MIRKGTLLLGLEPANCRVGGRSQERTHSKLQILQPGEVREFHAEIEVSEVEQE
jgi:hypothetical protein